MHTKNSSENTSENTQTSRNATQSPNVKKPLNTSSDNSFLQDNTLPLGNIKKSLSISEEIDVQSVIPQFLLDHFISMTNLKDFDFTELTTYCAYFFPAVAMILGSENFHLLTPTIKKLATDQNYQVRGIVASSLHELAVVLGPEVTTKLLTPIFEDFWNDLDAVRIGILKNFADFLKVSLFCLNF